MVYVFIYRGILFFSIRPISLFFNYHSYINYLIYVKETNKEQKIMITKEMLDWFKLNNLSVSDNYNKNYWR